MHCVAVPCYRSGRDLLRTAEEANEEEIEVAALKGIAVDQADAPELPVKDPSVH